MTQRDVTIKFKGDSSSLTGASREASQGLRQTNDQLSKNAAEAAKAAKQQQLIQDSLRNTGLVAGATAAAIGALFAKGTMEFIEFSNALKQSGVVSGSFGTPEFAALSDEVERLGIVTSKAPAEVARMSVSLSRAGFTAEESAAALEGIVRASEATGESLEVVGDIAAKTIRTFGLAAEDSGRIADILVATANNTNTTVAGIGNALSYVGSIAASTNQPIEDIAIAIGLLGDVGIDASMAGTNLRAALQRLNVASAANNSEFAELSRGATRYGNVLQVLGNEIRDSEGKLKPLTEILKILRENVKELSEEDKAVVLNALFGVEGGNAIGSLLNVTDERLALVTERIRESEGVAVAAGEAMLTGLGGALELLGGSAGTASAKVGEFAAVGLEPLIRLANDVLVAFLDLPAPIQNLLIAVTGFVGVLSAAIAATVAFQIANKQLAIVETAVFVQTQALTAAKSALAIATGKASASQLLLARNLAATAGKLGLFAAAGASVGLVVDTFREMNEEARQTADNFKVAADAYEAYLEALSQQPYVNTDESENALDGVVTSNRQQLEDNLNFWQRGLNSVQEALGTVGIAGGSIIEGKIAEQSDAFLDAQGEMDSLIQEFQRLDAMGLENVSEDQLGAFKAAVEASASALAEEQPLTAGAAIAKQQYGNALTDIIEKLSGTADAEEANTEAMTEGTEMTEEQMQARIEAFERANAAADAAASRSEANRTASIKANQLEQLRAEGLTADERTRINEEAARQIEAIELNSLTAQMERLRAQLDELNALRAEGIVSAEEAADREAQIQEQLAQANLQRIEAELEAQERAIEEARQAELDAIEEVRLAANNQAEQRIQKIEAVIQAQERLNQKLGIQLDLLGAQSGLLSTVNDYTDSSYGIAIELTTDESDRAALEEDAAQARVEGLERSQAIEQQIFDLGILRRDIELEIEAIRLRSARARNQADQTDAQAAIDQARAEGATQEELNALQNRYNATLQEGAAIDAEEEGIRQSRALLQQTAALERESMLSRQRQEMDRERVNRAQAIVDPEDRERALDLERRRAVRNARSGDRRSEEIYRSAIPSLTAQPMNNIVPAQGAGTQYGNDFRQALTELGDRLTTNPTAVNQTNTVNIYPATAQALQQDVESVVLDQFDKVASALESSR